MSKFLHAATTDAAADDKATTIPRGFQLNMCLNDTRFPVSTDIKFEYGIFPKLMRLLPIQIKL